VARYVWTSESVVEIQAKSSVHPIKGEIKAITGDVTGAVEDGKILLDPMPSGYIECPVDALKSGNKLEDFEMRRRVEAKKFPTIRFDLREASGGPEEFKLRCALTFHGVTKEFEETCTAKFDGDKLLVEGQHTFNIEEYGVTAPKIMNLKVYPDVTIVAHLVGGAA